MAIVGGEALPLALMQKWSASLHFINSYGPTEAAVAITAMSCTPDMAYPFSIGKPFHNAHGYIVDPDDPARLVPPGVPGFHGCAGPDWASGGGDCSTA